jgi:hypothetical protein
MDLADDQWSVVKPYIPGPENAHQREGRPAVARPARRSERCSGLGDGRRIIVATSLSHLVSIDIQTGKIAQEIELPCDLAQDACRDPERMRGLDANLLAGLPVESKPRSVAFGYLQDYAPVVRSRFGKHVAFLGNGVTILDVGTRRLHNF